MNEHKHIYCSLGNTTDDLQHDIDAARQWIAKMDRQTYLDVLALIDAQPVHEAWVGGLQKAGAPEPTCARADWRGYVFAMSIRGRAKTPCFACAKE